MTGSRLEMLNESSSVEAAAIQEQWCGRDLGLRNSSTFDLRISQIAGCKNRKLANNHTCAGFSPKRARLHFGIAELLGICKLLWGCEALGALLEWVASGAGSCFCCCGDVWTWRPSYQNVIQWLHLYLLQTLPSVSSDRVNWVTVPRSLWVSCSYSLTPKTLAERVSCHHVRLICCSECHGKAAAEGTPHFPCNVEMRPSSL